MKSHALTLIYCSSLIISCVSDMTSGQSSKPDLSISPTGRIREGDTVLIQCRVSGTGPMDIVQIVRRIGETEHVIATNDYLKDRYLRTGRYWIRNWDNSKGLLELSISDIQAVDAGPIGCMHSPATPRSMPSYRLEDLIVDVPVQSVVLFYEAKDGRWYKAREGEWIQFLHGIRCDIRIDGSDVEPDVRIQIGDEAELEPIKSVKKEKIDVDGFTHINHTVSHTVELDGGDLKFHGKPLTCTASLSQFNSTSTATIFLEVPHAPQISCSPVWFTKPCTENYTVTCRALMYPRPASHRWTWGENSEYQLLNGVPNSPDIQRFHSSHSVNKHGEHVLSLTIDEVKNRDFLQYRLRATNSQGHDDVIVRISELPVVTIPLPSTTTKPLELFIERSEPSSYQLLKDNGVNSSSSSHGVASHGVASQWRVFYVTLLSTLSCTLLTQKSVTLVS